MNWLHLALSKIGLKDGVIAVLFVVVLGIVQQWHSDHVELEKAREVYSHPQVIYRDRIVREQGPVRIRTIIIKSPSGEERIEKTEERAEVVTHTDTGGSSAPVPIGVALKEPRSDRYLLSVGMNRLSPDFDGKALFVGYGWKNRFDVQVGGVRRDVFSPWVLATLRF